MGQMAWPCPWALAPALLWTVLPGPEPHPAFTVPWSSTTREPTGCPKSAGTTRLPPPGPPLPEVRSPLRQPVLPPFCEM